MVLDRKSNLWIINVITNLQATMYLYYYYVNWLLYTIPVSSTQIRISPSGNDVNMNHKDIITFIMHMTVIMKVVLTSCTAFVTHVRLANWLFSICWVWKEVLSRPRASTEYQCNCSLFRPFLRHRLSTKNINIMIVDEHVTVFEFIGVVCLIMIVTITLRVSYWGRLEHCYSDNNL